MCRNAVRLPSLSSQGARGLGVFLFCLVALLVCCEAAVQCSARGNGVSAFAPDIPVTVPGAEASAQSASNAMYIYPVSSPGCSGTVTGVQFCYSASAGTVFTLLIMRRTGSGNTLSVDVEVPIPTASSTQKHCSGITCCSTYTFTNEHFELPPGEFHLGVLTPNQLASFHTSQEEYSISGHRIVAACQSDSLINRIAVTTPLSIPMRIMRLIVESPAAAAAPLPDPSAQPSTGPPDTTQGATTLPTTTYTGRRPTVPTTDPLMPIVVVIVVGVLLLVVIILILVVCVCKQKRALRHAAVQMDQHEESYINYNSSGLEEKLDYGKVVTNTVTVKSGGDHLICLC